MFILSYLPEIGQTHNLKKMAQKHKELSAQLPTSSRDKQLVCIQPICASPTFHLNSLQSNLDLGNSGAQILTRFPSRKGPAKVRDCYVGKPASFDMKAHPM